MPKHCLLAKNPDCLLSRGKSMYATLGMRLLSKYIRYKGIPGCIILSALSPKDTEFGGQIFG